MTSRAARVPHNTFFAATAAMIGAVTDAMIGAIAASMTRQRPLGLDQAGFLSSSTPSKLKRIFRKTKSVMVEFLAFIVG